MTRDLYPLTAIDVGRHRLPRRRLQPLLPLPDRASAAAMDDPVAAEQLIDDLIALIDAGLVVAIDDHGVTRYAPADQNDPVSEEAA